MQRAWYLALCAFLAFAPLACSGEDSDRPAPDGAPITNPENGVADPTGESLLVELTDDETDHGVGFATFIADGQGSTIVRIEIEGAQPPGIESQPAYVGEGTCADREDVAYDLADIRDNESETSIRADFDEITSGEYFVTVQYSDDRDGVDEVVGCAVIEEARG